MAFVILLLVDSIDVVSVFEVWSIAVSESDEFEPYISPVLGVLYG